MSDGRAHRPMHLARVLRWIQGALLSLWWATVSAAPLADSLVDEACQSADREDVVALAGMPKDQAITCGKNRVGFVYSISGSGQEISKEFGALQDFVLASRVGNQLAQKTRCTRSQVIQSGPEPMALMACRLNSGGWPYLLVVGLSDGIVRVAEGPPSAIPALVIAIQPKLIKSRIQWLDLLKQTYAESVPLASSFDLQQFADLIKMARAANANGRDSESESLLRQALELQIRLLGESNSAIADTLMDLALVLSNRGRKDEAEALFNRAETIVQSSAKESDRARLFAYYGFHAANHGNFEGGLSAARNAVNSWRKVLVAPKAESILMGGSSTESGPGVRSGSQNLAMMGAEADDFGDDYLEKGELGLSLNLLAEMALQAGELPLAMASATEALTIFNDTRGLPPWWRSAVLLTLGNISSAQGRLSAAEKYLNTALKERRLYLSEGPQTIRVLIALASAYQREGMNSSAIITYREIFGLLKKLNLANSDSVSKEDLIPLGLAVVAYAKTLTDPAQIQGLYAEAFDAFQSVRPASVDKTVNQAAARLANGNPAIRSLLDRMAQAQRIQDTMSTELSFEITLPQEQRSREVEDRLFATKRAAELEFKKVEGELSIQFPDYVSLTKPQPLSLFQVRERLSPQEGLVSFLIGRKVSFVTLIRRDGIYLGEIKESETGLAETVTSLRRALEIQAGSVNEYDLDLAHGLYRTLFGEIEPWLQDLTHLIVAPSGPLASLPFSILVTHPPASPSYSEAKWLVNQAAISHAPSIQAFYALRTNERAAKPIKTLLAIGNPVLSGKQVRQGGLGASPLATSCRQDGPAPAELVSSLSALPDTEAEIFSVSQALGVIGTEHMLLGAEATEERLRARPLDQYRILYFATHGLLPGELKCQTEPGLVLTPPSKSVVRTNDGIFEASEIAALRINADLVVLSACNTAGAAGRFGGDALSGLAESFFFAGARSLLVSHWQVPSAATATLMSQLFRALGPDFGLGASNSLQSAQRRMIAIEQSAHPFFWGAFVLVGDGAADQMLPMRRGAKSVADQRVNTRSAS